MQAPQPLARRLRLAGRRLRLRFGRAGAHAACGGSGAIPRQGAGVGAPPAPSAAGLLAQAASRLAGGARSGA